MLDQNLNWMKSPYSRMLRMLDSGYLMDNSGQNQIFLR